MLKCYVDSPIIPVGDDSDDDANYVARVVYSYDVGPRKFTSKRLTYRPTSGLLYSGAIDQLRGLMAGREIDVFYDPRHPSRSVLVPGTSDDNIIRAVVAVVILAAVVWFAI